MKRSTLGIVSMVAAGVLAGCSDDGTGLDVELTEAEAAALTEAIMQATVVTMSAGPSGPATTGPLLAPYTTEVDVSFTADCPAGGTVDVDGEVTASGDDETGEGTLELSVEHDHHGCKVEAEDGTVFTFDGSPNLSLDLTIETDGEEELGWSGTIAGALNWATDEREGRCTVGLEFTGLVSGAEQEIGFAVEGAVCRHAVDLSWSLGLEPA